MPSITVKRPSGLSVQFRFSQDSIRIGRGPENDLVVRDASVSRYHAVIRREEAGWIVEDLKSSNGTELAGERIQGARALPLGAEVRVGDTRLFFDAAEGEGLLGDPDHGTYRTAPRDSDPWKTQPRLVGRSPGIRKVLDLVEKVAPSRSNVLITGENGTGKELVARLIHHRSPREGGPFVPVNCPALPGSLLEAELFGVEEGAATDVAPRTGKFEAAEGGTLLLDEVGDMDPKAQAKVLRVLEERVLERVGGSGRIPLDVRVLAATNHDLGADMEAGSFRRDLFHRLSTVTIHLPPLRERREDIPLLVEHFISADPEPAVELEPEAMDLLLNYEFPGNVRELKHLLEGARLFAEGPVLSLRDLREATHLGGRAATGRPETGSAAAEALYRRIVHEGGSFWDLVREPFLRREISRDEARRLVALAHERAGGSYAAVARAFGIEEQYKKFVNFLREHSLRVGD